MYLVEEAGKISLAKQNAQGEWTNLMKTILTGNGHIPDSLKVGNGKHDHGIYKMTYFMAPYFTKLDQESFCPFIEVVF